MSGWPDVTEGEGSPPRVAGTSVDEGLVLARPCELVAWGTVAGVPWQIQAYVTAPGRAGKWWEHGPVGPELEFFLGEDSAFGGGGAQTRLNEGTHLAATIGFFGSKPEIVSWLGVVSETVAAVEVRLDDGDVRRIELHDGPPGFHRMFWFFPPRGARGHVVALDDEGHALQRDPLVDVGVHPHSNAGTSVNSFGYRNGRPPPGWPDDPTAYGRGEGPRHGEDFHLHESPFPLYVLPPDRWDGYAGLAGSGTANRRLDHVDFGYFDEPGGLRRGFEVVNEHPERRHPEPSIGTGDLGIWRSEPFGGTNETNFAARFLTHDQRASMEDERGHVRVGPARWTAVVELEVMGRLVQAAHREYRPLPSLRAVRLVLPGVRVTLFGWGVSADELQSYAASLERLELDTELLRAMVEAQQRNDRRFRELQGHPDESG